MKKLKSYLVCIFELIIISCHIQAQDWPKIYYDNINATIRDLAEAYDNGYLLAGYTYNDVGWPQFDLITKIDINGNILWDKKFGNGSYSNGLSDFMLTSDNGMILAAGTTKYSGNYDPTFIKLNVCGEIDWCRVFQSPDQNYGTGIIQVADGSYIGMLQYYGEGESYARISLVKMDQTGEPMWIQSLAQEDTLIFNEEGNYLYLTCESNYLISGHAYHPGKHPFWIETDTSGSQNWDLFWNSLVGQAHQVIEKDTGLFYSTGWGSGLGRPQSPVLLKFDNNGYPVDSYFLMGDTIGGGSASGIDYLNDINLIIGITWKSAFSPVQVFSEVFLTDTLGNVLIRRVLLNEYRVPNQIVKTSDGKIIVSASYVTDGNFDIYLWKMNADLEDDTLYSQPLIYDSLCPYEILTDTVDLDCGVFVNIDELPIKEEYESAIKISPNPSRDWITLTLPDVVADGKVELMVYDVFGREAGKRGGREAWGQGSGEAGKRGGMEAGRQGGGGMVPVNRMVSLDVSGFLPGIYIAVIVDLKSRRYTGKFVVIR